MKQEISYKKVSEFILKDYKFIVPSYQRGYRWTQNNINQLFDDIYENDNEYYLQPLIVNQKKDGKWSVIDGQQRLTTILIMIAVLNYIFEIEDCIFFDLSYENRCFSKDFLNFLQEEVKHNDNYVINDNYIWDCWEEKCKEKDIDVKKNLDFDYMILAFCTIIDKYNNLSNKNRDELFNKILGCIFIWYPIEIDENENIREKEIQQFSKINTGKIPLTNAELIKVEILDCKDFQNVASNSLNRQFIISNRWHFIEKELHKHDFWAFIPHRNQYDNYDDGKTRIDYLFEFLLFNGIINKINQQENINFDENIDISVDLYRAEIKYEDSYDLYNRFFKFKQKNQFLGEQIWSDIEDIFANLVDLYENDGRSIHYIGDVRLYNLLSFFVYYNSRVDKDETFLKNYSLFYKMLLINKNDRVREITSALKRTMFPEDNFQEKIKAMRYGKNKDELREVLLLYNIIVLFQSEGLGNRYNFLKHSQMKWTREHIFPQSWDKNEAEKILRTKQKEILQYIICNLDDNGSIVLKNEFALRYINLLYGKENILRETNGDLKKCKYCPIEGRYNSGIISFEKDKEAIKEFEEKIKVQNEDHNYLNDYYKKLMLIKKSDELLEEIYVQEESRNITSILEVNNYEDYKTDILNHIKTNSHIFTKREVIKNFYSIDFKNKNNSDLLQNIKENLSIFTRDSIKNSDNLLEIIDGLDKIFNCKYEKTKFKNGLSKNIDALHRIFEQKREQNSETSLNKKDWIINISTDFDNQIIEIERNFRENCKDLYKHVINNIDKFVCNQDLINKIVENSIVSTNKTVDYFFEKEFDNLINDNSIGNMTLLDDKVNGSSQIGNKLLSDKKINIYKRSKNGDFIPLTTILTFSDIYTKNKINDNYWMFESRCEYLHEILSTIDIFLKGKNKNER